MNKKLILFAGAFTSALLGCATAQQTGGGVPGEPLKPVSTAPGPYPQDRYSAAFCAKDRCAITVTVTSACEVSVDPQWMGISSKITSPLIEWILNLPPGYTVDIFNKPEISSVRDRFDFERSTPTLITARVKTMKAPAIYHYGITAKNGGKTCKTIDPPIITDM
jgi:hypothetical protein